jgi:hypothetical protein
MSKKPVSKRRALSSVALVLLFGVGQVAGTMPGSTSAALSPGPTIGGCPTFPADNPWNRAITSLAVHANSAAWLESVEAASNALHPDFGSDPTVGLPYVIVPASQPGVKVRFDESPTESDGGKYPIPPRVPIEAGSDHHVLVVQRSTCRLFELFAARREGSGWVAGSGAIFNLKTNAMRPKGWTSADAAGLPILPGLVRYDEVQSGRILHALRVTFSATQKGFILPARHHAGKDNPSLPPMGARLRLRSDVDISNYTGQAKVIIEAMKTYGLMVADNGSDWFVTGATDSRWNDDDLHQLTKVEASMFEFVDSGPIERS